MPPSVQAMEPSFDGGIDRAVRESLKNEGGSQALSHTDPEKMLAFYGRLYPFRPLFQWLNHGNAATAAFTNREFAFTLTNDVYLRYQAFPGHEAMRKEVLRLNPSRFEIGPVYSACPRDRKTLRKAAFRPLQKELVFDIDMTDYDDVRTCCSKAEICEKCWGFMRVAIKVLDAALRQDFGFTSLLWVYSGRRGVHCWVSDARALALDDAKRRAIAVYLEVMRTSSQSSKLVDIRRPLHPSMARALDILGRSFRSLILDKQDPWRTSEQVETLLNAIPDKDLREALRKKWNTSANRPSSAKWDDIDQLAQSGASKTLDTRHLLEAKQDLVFAYTYPRLDAEVSKHLNHLLKAPFCIHPGTGRVCVPIDPAQADTFNPFAVPTLTQLLDEIDRYDEQSGANSGVADYEKTSLKPYVEYFKKFANALVASEVRVKRERDEENGSLDF